MILLVNLAFAALRPRARRIGRSLETERAPDGTRPCGVDGCRLRRGWRVPGAKVRGASGRGLLGRDSRQRGVLALGFVAASGKPYASAQAVTRCAQAGSSLHILRESVAACCWLLLRFKIREIFAKFRWNCSRWTFRLRYARQIFRACCSSFLSSFCNFYVFFCS